MSKTTFTIIIPNYNGLKYIEDCMAALKSQSYDSFNVLIVDNGSKDGSREYLEQLEKTWNEGLMLIIMRPLQRILKVILVKPTATVTTVTG